MSTIEAILAKANPLLQDEWTGKSRVNTKSGTDSYDSVDMKHSVKKWTDFNYEAIELAYGDILEQDIEGHPGYRDFDALPKTPTIINKEDDMDGLGIVWSCEVLRGPIKAAATALCTRFGISAADATLAPKKVGWAKDVDARVTISPDWVIMDHLENRKIRYSFDNKDLQDHHGTKVQREKPLVYAIGDSKLQEKWRTKTEPLGHHPRINDKEFMKPLIQMATYCRYGQTRYGYIFTQTELVALRVRRISKLEDSSTYRAGIEWESIPWGAKGPGKLTVNMAIWALGCMGMNNDHRLMEDASHGPNIKMAKLTYWREEASHYENVISKRQIPKDQFKKHPNIAFVTTEEKDGMTSHETFEPPAPVPAGTVTRSRRNEASNPPSQPPPQTGQASSSAKPPSENGFEDGGDNMSPEEGAYCKVGKDQQYQPILFDEHGGTKSPYVKLGDEVLYIEERPNKKNKGTDYFVRTKRNSLSPLRLFRKKKQPVTMVSRPAATGS